MGKPLGSAQRSVLRVLYEAKSHEESPPTATEIADVIAARRRPPNPHRNHVRDTAAVRSALRSLTTRELVRPLGVSGSGARCWEITDAGDYALEETVGVARLSPPANAS